MEQGLSLPILCSAEESRKDGGIQKGLGQGLVLQPGQTSLTSSWPSLHSSRGPLHGWGEAPGKENGEGGGVRAGGSCQNGGQKGRAWCPVDRKGN